MFVRLLSLFAAGTLTLAQLINLPTTVEIDLIFSLNEAYALIKPFPVSSSSKMPPRHGTLASNSIARVPIHRHGWSSSSAL